MITPEGYLDIQKKKEEKKQRKFKEKVDEYTFRLRNDIEAALSQGLSEFGVPNYYDDDAFKIALNNMDFPGFKLIKYMKSGSTQYLKVEIDKKPKKKEKPKEPKKYKLVNINGTIVLAVIAIALVIAGALM